MTLRLVIGIDPGLTGGVAVLADGQFELVSDIPTRSSPSGRTEVCAGKLSAMLRRIVSMHPGAWIEACLEQVSGGPVDGRKKGSAGAFRFGESVGVVKGALGALGIPYSYVQAAQWKRYYSLTGCDKDAGRVLAIRRFPKAADQLSRKKDHGRAESLLIALWHENNEMGSQRTAA